MESHYCFRCRWWKLIDEKEGYGFCRKRAPRVLSEGNTLWPSSYSNDLCGDWKRKKGEEDKEEEGE